MVSIKELWSDGKAPVIQTVSPAERTNIYDGKALTEFFTDSFSIEQDVESRYMAILWSHGAGLGYVGNLKSDGTGPDYLQGITPTGQGTGSQNNTAAQNNITEYNDLMRQMTFLKSHLSIKGEPIRVMNEVFQGDKVKLKPSDTSLLDERLQLITAVQMNTIFQNALPKDKKIDVLITNTCYTQLLETGYALKDTVSVLISPQTTIPFTGFNYNALFRQMERQPDLTAADIAVNVRSNFNKKYDDPHFKKHFRILTPSAFALMGEVSFSANDLSHYGEFVEDFFSGMAERFWQAAKPGHQDAKLLKVINAARAKCLDISPSAPFNSSNYGIIDLTHFFRTFTDLCRKNGIPGWDDPREQFEHLMKKIRIVWHKASGPGQYSEHRASRSPYFLSFFFPSKNVNADMVELLIKVYLRLFNTRSLPKDLSKWPDFIIRWMKP
ncbi:hypothetical protein GCM10011511_54020 [Puia dinghuensis]|uniref:Uncharacterized protein n=2 Tax=Puia dinghuensis TaxID=1792502 RepID=A0A8J2UIT4_9BACT|nr:hypothetical protein GCM10011511_54020 [Puia dinghuensis]